jgi:hypothetical protein
VNKTVSEVSIIIIIIIIIIIPIFLVETYVVKSRLTVGCVLYIPSHNFPGFAVFFLYGPPLFSLTPSPLSFVLSVPNQGGAGNPIII